MDSTYSARGAGTANGATACPGSRFEFTNRATGEVIEGQGGRCRRNTCPGCVRWKLGFFQRAIARSRPQALLTIADLELEPAAIRSAWGRFRRVLRERAGLAYEDLYSIEPHHDGRLHVHALVRGRLTEHQALRAAAAAGLGGNVDVRPITYAGGLRYVVKRAADADTLATHLVLNGGRLFFASRGFWVDEDGVPVPGGYLSLGAPWPNHRSTVGRRSPSNAGASFRLQHAISRSGGRA